MAEGKRACGAPLSWLVLERLAIGEVPADEAERAREHLAGCEVCRGCLQKIEEEKDVPLPALPERREARGERQEARGAGARVYPWVFGAVAMAAAVLLYVRTRAEETRGDGTKGQAVSITLVRESGGGEAGVFGPGDRFKALVSCPPALVASWDLVVFDEEGSTFPLAPIPSLACGNAVPIPGAFKITGDKEVSVCVVWNDRGPIERAVLGPTDLLNRRNKACQVLRPGR